MATYLVLTIIGDDKPGLVEKLAETIARHSGSWLESNMSHLAGKFAGILRVSVEESHADALVSDLQALSSILKLVVEKVQTVSFSVKYTGAVHVSCHESMELTDGSPGKP